jgi:fimbrial chaperone protein
LNRLPAFFLLALGAICALPAAAAPFEIGVAPSRFVLAAKPGGRLGQSITVQNIGQTAADVAIRTLDWNFTANGGIEYQEDLAPGSCRPWVTLERRKLTVAPRVHAPFRFQVDVPPDAARGECRFMIAFESAEPAATGRIGSGSAALSLPVSGRIAIAIYVAVGGAEPKLALTTLGTRSVAGKPVFTATVVNTGDAHGRVDGALEAVDARGQKFELVPEGSPVLPGQTRTLSFSTRALANQKLEDLALPVRASGQIDWESGSFKVNTEFK